MVKIIAVSIPSDGKVIAGEISVDESMVYRESPAHFETRLSVVR
jgi:high-affinity K+ transport system ATPase subunit B